MESKHRDKEVETEPVFLELGHDGLRVLARMIARVHLEKARGKKEGGGANDTRKR